VPILRACAHRRAVVMFLPLLLVAVAGCGGSSSKSTSTSSSPPATTASTSSTPAAASTSAGASKLALTADPNGALSFDKKTLTAKAGKVTVTMANPKSSGLPHGVAIEGNGVDKDGKTVQAGGTSTVTLTLKPGTYSYYCPVPGHKAAGMKGTLTVQ
jgi:plastocyanin